MNEEVDLKLKILKNDLIGCMNEISIDIRNEF
jgi:hypothetical protein